MPTWKDRVKQAVTTGGSGALVIGSAASGFQALAAGDDGKVFRYVIEDGAAWETGYGIYTHSGTSFARTSRDASSTGSALTVSTSAFLFVDLTAAGALAADNAGRGVQPGGRLTLTTGVPVTTADVTGATSIYYTPFVSDVITLWDGNLWVPVQFSELTLALGTLVANVNYDIFAYLSSGAATLESAVWKNATVTITIATPGVVSWVAHGMSNGDPFVFATTGALPTGFVAGTVYWVVSAATDTFQLASTPGGTSIATSGSQSGVHTGYKSTARTTNVTMQDGRYCKSGDKTRLYLGTFRTTSTTTTEDSAGGVTTNVGGKRFLWNAYNRRMRSISVFDSTATWNYLTATYRSARATFANRVEFVCGLGEDAIQAEVMAGIFQTLNTGFTYVSVGIGVDTTTTNLAWCGASYNEGSGNFAHFLAAKLSTAFVAAGYHYVAWLEKGGTGTNNLFFGNVNPGANTGLVVEVMA